MALPIVAVVGRPNVGKSTFFNKVSGKRISIVEDKVGVTRDRLYADCEWCGYNFTLIDTGGLETKSQDTMWQHIKRQAEFAVEAADVIIFLVDGKQGLLTGDYDIADFLRSSKKPVCLAVNKLDNNEMDKTFEFWNLGIGEPFAVSAEQSKGLGDLLDEVVSHFNRQESAAGDRLNIAVVGRPNAGKSSLVNRLLGYERVIVSDIAGTTRDAIDTPFECDGKSYNLIDTAGMRRKRSIDEEVESYSVMRALSAIRRADVVVVVIDASQPITEQDVRICGYVNKEGKPSVVLMNKWDMVEKDTHTINTYKDQLDGELKFMDYYVPLFISAKTGQRVDKLMQKVNDVYQASQKRISTGVLNEAFMDAVSVTEPPSKNGKRLKIYYVTQANVAPPTFILFVNDDKLVHFSYQRYLENAIRKTFDFEGTPIRLIFRNRSKKEDNIK